MIERRNLMKELALEKGKLEQIKTKAERQIKAAPQGTIRITRYKKGVQFFQRLDPKEKNGKYLPKSKIKYAEALIQKKYNKKLVQALDQGLDALGRFLNSYDPFALVKVYESCGQLMQSYIKATELPDKEFKELWQQQPYEGKAFSDDTPVHLTSRGERVRSKSEVMIADSLHKNDIAYRYECPLTINNQVFHPDFTILRLSDRKEMYWEHVGLLDKSDYREAFLAKIRAYAEAGIFLGDRLILTFETAATPLNLRMINLNIKHYLL